MGGVVIVRNVVIERTLFYMVQVACIFIGMTVGVALVVGLSYLTGKCV